MVPITDAAVEGHFPRRVDTSSCRYAASVMVRDVSWAMGLSCPFAEWRRQVLYRVSQRKTVRRQASAKARLQY